MYRTLKPSDTAMRAESPSKTPGATTIFSGCCNMARSLLTVVIWDMLANFNHLHGLEIWCSDVGWIEGTIGLW